MHSHREVQSVSQQGGPGSRFGGRTIVGIVLLILTLILLGIVTTFSWWNLSADSGYTSGWYLGNVCSAGSCQDYSGYPALHDTFGLTNALVLGAIGLAVVAFVLFVLSIFWPRIGAGVLVTGILGSLLLLAAPIYLYVALPGALQSSTSSRSFVTGFFGSATTTGLFGGTTTWNWGGGTGWYMAFVEFAIFLVATLVAFSASQHLLWLGSFRLAPIGSAAAPQPAYPSAPQSTMIGVAQPSEMFCPACGSRYPAGTQFCSKDATALKEVTQ